MDSSHAGTDKADLKILGDAQSLRLWQDRDERRGSKSLKRQYAETELDLGLDEKMDWTPPEKATGHLLQCHLPRRYQILPSSPEIPNPATPHYSPSPVCTRLSPPSIQSNSSRHHTSSQPPHLASRHQSQEYQDLHQVSQFRLHLHPTHPLQYQPSVEDMMPALSVQLCIMNSTLSDCLFPAFQGCRYTHSSKMESTISLAGATYQSLTTSLRQQERADQDLLKNH